MNDQQKVLYSLFMNNLIALGFRNVKSKTIFVIKEKGIRTDGASPIQVN